MVFMRMLMKSFIDTSLPLKLLRLTAANITELLWFKNIKRENYVIIITVYL